MPNREYNIIFVDDEQHVLDGIRRMLKEYKGLWSCHFTRSVDEALSLASRLDPDLIVTDMMMPGKTGLDLLSEVQRAQALCHIPTVVLTGSSESGLKRKALENGALDLINKPISTEDLIARLKSALRLSDSEKQLREYVDKLEKLVYDRTRDLEHANKEIIWRLACAGELRDHDTGNHVARVADCSAAIAEAMGLMPGYVEDIRLAATLHDVGKVGISDSILLKPGPLSTDEMMDMREHCQLGYQLLTSPNRFSQLEDDGTGILHMAAEIARSHHERWDGAGYPDGLKGEEIPLPARIVAFADALDAVCQKRVYKDAIPFEEAFSRLIGDAGTHFDPGVVEAAIKCLMKLTRISAGDAGLKSEKRSARRSVA